MKLYKLSQKNYRLYRLWLSPVIFLLSLSLLIPIVSAQSVLNLPEPGTMVGLSSNYTPAIVIGLTLYPDNPLQFDFIIDVGDDNLQDEALGQEAQRLINYFMATLTVPEDQMWVNLSPYEKDRIIAEGLGNTELGRDLLAQDYLLKQITASLMYPEGEFGSTFWQRVYEKAEEKFGTTEIPTNTFNKIWIVPQEAILYVSGTNIFIAQSRLKVMLEEDYLALEHHDKGLDAQTGRSDLTAETKNIIREVFIPEIEREVNEGKNFATLRQIYHSVILATWYKNNLKGSLLGKIYVNQNKVNGVAVEDKEITNKIYNQYVSAFKKGVYNYVKEDYDPGQQQVIPRKYFSGGKDLTKVHRKTTFTEAVPSDSLLHRTSRKVRVREQTKLSNGMDAAMLSRLIPGSLSLARDALDGLFDLKAGSNLILMAIRRVGALRNKAEQDLVRLYKNLSTVDDKQRKTIESYLTDEQKVAGYIFTIENTDDVQILEIATKRLVELADESYINLLLNKLSSTAKQAFEDVLRGLGVENDRIVDGYLQALTNRYPSLMTAIDRLGDLEDSRAIGSLLKLAFLDINKTGIRHRPDVYEKIALALEKLGDTRLLHVYRQLISNPNVHLLIERPYHIGYGTLSTLFKDAIQTRFAGYNFDVFYSPEESHVEKVPAVYGDPIPIKKFIKTGEQEVQEQRTVESGQSSTFETVKEDVGYYVPDGYKPYLIKPESEKTVIDSPERFEIVRGNKVENDPYAPISQKDFESQQDQPGDLSDIDQAQLSDQENKSPDYGGIDLNANNLKINVRGEEIEFTVPGDLQGIQPESVNQVTPVIINIVPVSNFSFLLGLSNNTTGPHELSRLP